jgi:hypothetical protein
MSIDETTKNHARQFANLQDQFTNKFYEWFKNIILIASGLLGALVSLHTRSSVTYIEHYLFVITVCGLAVGILTGSIYLYAESHTVGKTLNSFGKKAAEYLDGKNQGDIVVSESASKIFLICYWISCVTLVTSLICLAGYAIVIDNRCI